MPETQITFRGVSAARLAGAVVLTGSRSGSHSGTIESDSDGQGGSFLPAKPFDGGEVVTVTAVGLNVLGASNGTFSFTIAMPGPGIHRTPFADAARVRGDVNRFPSRLDLAPAAIKVTRRSRTARGGDIFVAPQNGPVQDGPMILDSGGGLVWFDRVPRGEFATDFRVQRYRGRPVLTWWQGVQGAGVGSGNDVIFNASYREIAAVHAANGLIADLHEFQLTGRSAALITAYHPVFVDASSVHGSKHQLVIDSVVQEIDIPTGLVLFQWDSLDHVPLGESYSRPPPVKAQMPDDYFHVNSIQRQSDGNLLISARDTWAAYMVDGRSGAVLWRLGGKKSTFRVGAGASFAFQHDVRMRSPDLVSLFDDGAGPPVVHKQSRGLELRLDFKHKTATRVVQYQHTPSLQADFEGNLQWLPAGERFLGWGQQPFFTEFDARGRMIFDGQFVGSTTTYRAYRFSWSGTPQTPPAVAATSGRHATAYASWNGATNVAVWKVLGGPTPHRLHFLAAARRRGFETVIPIPSQRYVVALAVDRVGRRLGASSTVRAG